jgi:hypothetical protein
MTSLLIALMIGAQPSAGHLTFKAPQAWHSRTPASSMRVAEFVIPHAAGDSEDAELIVYYFGAQGGGSAQANIDRWIGQMQRPDGQPVKDSARTQSRTINGLTVTTVDVSGTYVAEVRPGSSEHYKKPGFTLSAAVVTTPNGAYYIKLTGPARTVAAAQRAYDDFLGSLSFSASPPE